MKKRTVLHGLTMNLTCECPLLVTIWKRIDRKRRVVSQCLTSQTGTLSIGLADGVHAPLQISVKRLREGRRK